jgi:hypothetical protein
MTDIINLILAIVATMYVCRFLAWLFRRVSLVVKLEGLKKLCGAKIIYQRFPFLPTAMASEKADVIVEILDTVYLIRLYSGGGSTKFVHFASPKYSVRYSRLRTGRFVINGRIRSRFITFADSAFNVGTRVIILPDFPIPSDDRCYGKRVERVILFNPAPTEVSFVTEEKTSIRTAFAGDEMYGVKVFTASSFISHADRETRKNDEMTYF